MPKRKRDFITLKAMAEAFHKRLGVAEKITIAPEPEPIEPEPLLTIVVVPETIKPAKKTRSERKQAFWEYSAKVWKLTNTQPLTTLKDYGRRGFNDYHLDHIVSITSGLKYGIPAQWIADISNLRMIPYGENMAKGKRQNRSIGPNTGTYEYGKNTIRVSTK